MAEWTNAAKVGVFVVAAAGAAWGIYRFVSRTAGTEGGYTVYAELGDATGLAPQSRVLMAGIPVGTIQSIRLDHGMARIDVKVKPGVVLHEDAAAAKRSTSLLGEYFIAVSPGTEGRPALHDGDRIPTVLETPTTDKIMQDLARIADRVKLVSETLANTLGTPEGQAQMQATVKNLADVTEALNETVRENRETIRRTLINVQGITDRTAPELQAILENIRTVTQDVRQMVTETHGEAKPGAIRETVDRVRNASASLENTLAHIESVSERLDKGEGTLGRLTKDETLVNEVEGVVEGVGEFVGGISRLQTIVGLRSDYNFYSNTVKSFLELRLQPTEDKYYMIEFINDPRGRVSVEQIDEDTTDPNEPPHKRITRKTTTNAFRFSLMFARRLGPFTGRFGIKESTGGLGVDTHLLNDRFELQQDLFGFGEQLQPRWRIALGYEFIRRLWMLGGVDDILTSQRDYFLGLQLRFNDQDLKTILPFAGAGAAGATAR